MCRAAKTDFGNLAFRGRADLEEFARLEIEHARDDVRREDGDFGVEVADHGVVIPARVLHAVFDLIQRLLKLRETFDGAKLRISFRECENLAQRGSKRAFRFGLRR